MTVDPAAVQVREATEADLPAILGLLTSSLGWVPDEQHEAFYRWKHLENPFGRSPAWVAVDGGQMVALRVWLRWRFRRAGRTWHAVRAVDTATHPDHQGRGIFRLLTTSSLDPLRAQGIDHVFNTPNEQSRPGYLKMGWTTVGRLPVAARFRSPAAAVAAVRARVPADKWSLSTDGGLPANDALADNDEIAALLERLPDDRVRTDLSVEVLRWRYGFAPLRYRAVHDADGIALFRLRRRGPAIECVVGHVLARGPRAHRRLLRRVARVSGADQTLWMGGLPSLSAAYLPVPGAGPVLTWREVGAMRMPELREWALTMGDVELF